jgi:hypothetical protein
MQQRELKSRLIRNIRREPVNCPGLNRQQLFNIRFSQFGGSEGEIPSIIAAVASKLGQMPIRGQLVNKLETEYIPAAASIAALCGKLLRIFVASIKQEPCTSAYYTKVIPHVRNLMEMANTICESEHMLQEKVISGDTIYVEDMEEYVDNMSNYLGELEDCYDAFNYFLQNETNDCADKSNSLVRLTSRVEQYLFKLLDLVELSIVLINTGRGSCINTADVIAALEEGHIGYFGMDVYEFEKGIFFYDLSGKELNDQLMSMPNVLITPHQGFATREALTNIASTTFYNIHCWESQQSSENELIRSETLSPAISLH